jgi:hypothetical protein
MAYMTAEDKLVAIQQIIKEYLETPEYEEHIALDNIISIVEE